MPRIALLTHSFPPALGGVEAMTQAQALGFADRCGADVVVLTRDGEDPSGDSAQPFRVLRRPDLRTVLAELRRADVAVFNAPILAWCLLALITRTRRIGVLHSWLFDPTDPNRRARGLRSAANRAKAVARIGFLRGCDRVIACSAAVARDTAKSAVVIHNGIDTNNFRLLRPLQDRPAGHIAYMGRLGLEKGVSYLVEAIAQLAPEHPDLRLTLIGSGPESTRLEGLAEDLGIADRVQLLGRLHPAESNRFLNEHAIAVVPSVWKEAFGLSAVEAQAAGCAVIAADVGGLPEALHGTGAIVQPRSAAAIADALRALLSDPDALRHLQRRGAENAAQHSRERMIDRYWQVIAELIPGDSARRSTH